MALLAFPQMGGRSAIVEDALSNTCQWLFSTPEYESWCDPASYVKHHGFLWIRGKPGAGKSTAMKTLLNRAQSGQDGERLLSFFFNARGEALERSIEGLYRSLLYQATASISKLPPEITYGLDGMSPEAYQRDCWQVGLLKSLIKKTVLQLGSKIRWSCYIDAIDEGDDEDGVRNMLEYLEELTEAAHEQGLHLSVCLASRHYPKISVPCLEELNLDDHIGHLQDIDTYVRRKTANYNATIPEDIVASIKERASGVFLWVVLVIAELKKNADHGNHHKLRSLLESIPDGVERLLDRIVGKADPDGRLMASLQWGSFAFRPLTPKEFYTAMMLSLGALKLGSVEWDTRVDATVIHNIILSASRGLLETVALPQQHRPADKVRFSLAPQRDDLVAGRVQFIHESVREYFLHKGLLKVDPTLQEPIRGACQERLARWCSDYFHLTNCSELAKRLRPTIDRHEWWRFISNRFPLLKYTMDGMLMHADAAAYYGSKQTPFGANLPFECWLTVKSCVLENTKTHPCHASRLPSLLHALVSEKCSYLVDIELSSSSSSLPKDTLAHLDATSLPYEEDTGLLAAETENQADQSVNKIAASCIGGAIHTAVSQSSVKIARSLIRSGADPNDHCQIVGSPLSIALGLGNHRMEMVTMLTEHGARLKEDCTNQCRHHTGSRGSPLCNCALEGGFDLVELLLRYGADPDARDSAQCTPLWVAIARGHPDIVQVLLEYGADANATFPSCGESGCNILSTAVKIYMWSPSRWSEIDTIRLEIVRLLLKHGAIDVRCGRCSRTALDFAQRSGNQRLVELLLIAMKTTSLNIAPKTGPKTQRSRDHRSPHPSQP
jgi:hypothetical protein